MDYSLSMITTVAQWGALLVVAQKDKENLERRRRNLNESIGNFEHLLPPLHRHNIHNLNLHALRLAAVFVHALYLSCPNLDQIIIKGFFRQQIPYCALEDLG
jgi:hypothetical protein